MNNLHCLKMVAGFTLLIGVAYSIFGYCDSLQPGQFWKDNMGKAASASNAIDDLIDAYHNRK